MDSETFESFCFQLLAERHPGAQIRRVEGAGGDKGVDIFVGELSGGLTIWQCKAFPNGIGRSQKEQIESSLANALKNFSPKRWILCTSVDLSIKAHRWFQELQESNRGQVEIGLYSASDIEHELIHRASLREAFFPDAVINVREIKRMITRSGELTPQELESVTEANLEDYIERLKERDARFNYEVVFSRDLGPDLATHRSKNVFMSMRHGDKTVNVYVRDVEALKANPPTVTIEARPSGSEKLDELLRTGISQELTETDVVDFRTNWGPFPDTGGPFSGHKLLIGPSERLTERRIRTRVTFRSSSDSVEYAFIEFAPTRAGTEEVEIQSTTSNVPFTLKFVIRLGSSSGQFSISEHIEGCDLRSVQKFVRALNILQTGGEVVVHELEHDRQSFSGRPKGLVQKEKQKVLQALIDDLIDVQERFGVQFKMPDRMTEQDLESLALVKQFMTGGNAEIEEMKGTLVKSAENEATLPTILRNGGAFRFEHSNLEPQPEIFGVKIPVGHCAMTADRARFENIEATISTFQDAAFGEAIEFTLRPEVPVRFELLDTAT